MAAVLRVFESSMSVFFLMFYFLPRYYFLFLVLEKKYSILVLLDLGRNIKPILHGKLCLRWLPNANEIDTNNLKCTCPTPAPTPEGPTPPIFH